MRTCPRRSWGATGQEVWRSDHTCSYCGSIDPDLLLDMIENGSAEVTPTGKDYKVYVKHANGEAGKAYFQHFEAPHRTQFSELLNAGKVRLGPPGYFPVKPSFMA